jgi:hypothetical protein
MKYLWIPLAVTFSCYAQDFYVDDIQDPCAPKPVGDCWRLYSYQEPETVRVWRCEEEPLNYKRRACRYAPKYHEVTKVRYVPEYYTEVVCSYEPEYYETCECRMIKKWVCDTETKYVTKYFYKRVCTNDECSNEVPPYENCYTQDAQHVDDMGNYYYPPQPPDQVTETNLQSSDHLYDPQETTTQSYGRLYPPTVKELDGYPVEQPEEDAYMGGCGSIPEAPVYSGRYPVGQPENNDWICNEKLMVPDQNEYPRAPVWQSPYPVE